MKEDHIEAMRWALNGNHLKVIPIPQKESYTIMISNNGGRPRRTPVPYVKLCIEIGNGKHIGKELYKQDSQMSDKIGEIYIHYYKQRKK